jgi:FkbM family methyltransferase
MNREFEPFSSGDRVAFGGRMIKRLLRTYLPEAITIHLHAADYYINGDAELHILKHVCSKRRAAVDIGANIGIYTYFLRRHAAKVHAYEPNPELALRLRKVFSDVNVRNVACSDVNGRTTLRVPVEEGRVQHELGSVAQNFEDVAEVLSYEVQAVTLDSEGLTDVGFIKIDAEQAERHVLKGSIETIRKWRPNIMVEVSPLLYESALPQAFEFLTAEKYEGWFSFNKRYYPFSLFNPEIHANAATWGKSSMVENVFFLPKEYQANKMLFGAHAGLAAV